MRGFVVPGYSRGSRGTTSAAFAAAGGGLQAATLGGTVARPSVMAVPIAGGGTAGCGVWRRGYEVSGSLIAFIAAKGGLPLAAFGGKLRGYSSGYSQGPL